MSKKYESIKSQAITMYSQGASLRAVAVNFDIQSPGTIMYWLRQTGVARRSKTGRGNPNMRFTGEAHPAYKRLERA